ncbi:hypothetical protein [Massilia endophytica]|nr:hypothetical protein [Massilia endophytica]
MTMKRLFAMLAFLAGAVAAEVRQPLHCDQLPASAGRIKRRGV